MMTYAQRINEINQAKTSAWLAKAAENAVLVEWHMRLIAEYSEDVRTKLQELIQKVNRKVKHKKYWNCDLHFLDQAITAVFSNELDQSEKDLLEHFRKLRNCLLHANFIDLMTELKISPAGREIKRNPLTRRMERQELEPKDIKESLKSIENNIGFQKFNQKADETTLILNKIIKIISD